MIQEIFPGFTRPLIFAHRGASSLAPENTPAAFKKARELGCPGIELDVHLCKTGELVVIHDNNMKRTGRCKNPQTARKTVEELTFAELREYDIGSWFSPDFAGEKIAVLDEVLDILGDHIYVDIEIKIESPTCEAVAKKTAEALNRRNRNNTFMASSFNPFAVRYFKKYSNIPAALIYANDPSVPFLMRRGQGRFFCRPDAMKPCWKDMDIDRQRSLRGQGPGKRRPYVLWTIDDRGIAAEAVHLGAQGIISNRAQDILAQFPQQKING